MIKTIKSRKLYTIILAILYSIQPRINAQSIIIPDKTLPASTTVLEQGNVTTINGGTSNGQNLFHSLEKFSVFQGETAYFNNSIGIKNIITRVTGFSSSNIDGLIKANGNANLFLINQNGIIFGSNSQLSIGGSFLGTTASGIKFADGIEFSASSAQRSKFLSISDPVALEFQNTNGPIQIQNSGHTVKVTSPSLTRQNYLSGLQVNPGKTLTLVGNGVTLDGGILTALQGTIEIGSVNNGNVIIKNSDFDLGYEQVSSYNDIFLTQYSLIDTSGINKTSGSGSIHLQGKKINIESGSLLLDQNFGSAPGKPITISSSELNIYGTKPGDRIKTGILSEVYGSGKGSNIDITTDNLNITEGSSIDSSTLGSAKGGDLVIKVSNAAKLMAIPSFQDRKSLNATSIGSLAFSVGEGGDVLFSTNNLNLNGTVTINTNTYGLGKGGDLSVYTSTLDVKNGGSLGTFTTGPGHGGNSIVRANLISLIGESSSLLTPSVINAATFSKGNAGNLTIFARQMYIGDGARVDTAALAQGDAGILTINVSDFLHLSGSGKITGNPSTIDSSASIVSPIVQAIFRVPPIPTGKSGSVIINADKVYISDSARISVTNDGKNDAGIVQINANGILLRNKGKILATTSGGNGGNINLVSSSIVLQQSNISANATTKGQGGNIDINTGVFAGDRKSSVLAQAVQGNGGNININAGGIIGSPYISASSDLGVDGTVQIRGDELKRQNNFKFTPKPTTPNLKPNCVPGSEGGRLIGVTRDYINDEVLDNLAARPEQLKFVDDTDGGKIKPLIRERGYVKRSDGKLEFIYLVPADAVISSKHNLSACTLLEKSATNPQNVVEQLK